MPTIRSITELRNTMQISELCHKCEEPVFITKNGCEDMVIMSNEFYEREMAVNDVLKKLLAAQVQIDSGNLLDGEESLKKLREKYRYAK